MKDLPQPLVPTDVDLRDFPYMPLDIVRLFGSEFHARSNDATWRAGLTLWLKSYHQVPAASIPDDDVAMARLSELGRDLKAWKKLKAEALHGWVKCSDGRLYHPVVAEKALEGWIEKLTQRKSSQAGNAKRYGTTFDAALLEKAIDECRALLANLNPHSRVLAKRFAKSTTGAPDNLPPGDDRPSGGSSTGSPSDIPSGSQGKGSKEKGTNPPTSHSGPAAEVRVGVVRLFEQANSPTIPDTSGVEVWLAQGYLPDLILAVVKAGLASNPSARSLRYFEPALKRAHEEKPAATAASDSKEMRVEFGGGYSAPASTIRSIWGQGKWLQDWGPRPDEPGCRVPEELLNGVSV